MNDKIYTKGRLELSCKMSVDDNYQGREYGVALVRPENGYFDKQIELGKKVFIDTTGTYDSLIKSNFEVVKYRYDADYIITDIFIKYVYSEEICERVSRNTKTWKLLISKYYENLPNTTDYEEVHEKCYYLSEKLTEIICSQYSDRIVDIPQVLSLIKPDIMPTDEFLSLDKMLKDPNSQKLAFNMLDKYSFYNNQLFFVLLASNNIKYKCKSNYNTFGPCKRFYGQLSRFHSCFNSMGDTKDYVYNTFRRCHVPELKLNKYEEQYFHEYVKDVTNTIPEVKKLKRLIKSSPLIGNHIKLEIV